MAIDTDYRIRMDNKVVDVYETNALFYKVYVETDINDNGLLYVSIRSGDLKVEADADTTRYNDEEVFAFITEDLESQVDELVERKELAYVLSAKNYGALEASYELADYLEGVNDMWTNYDSWAEVSDSKTNTDNKKPYRTTVRSWHVHEPDIVEDKYFLVTNDGVEVEAPFDKWWAVVNHDDFNNDRNERITSSVEK